jgi:hypothetical protein
LLLGYAERNLELKIIIKIWKIWNIHDLTHQNPKIKCRQFLGEIPKYTKWELAASTMNEKDIGKLKVCPKGSMLANEGQRQLWMLLGYAEDWNLLTKNKENSWKIWDIHDLTHQNWKVECQQFLGGIKTHKSGNSSFNCKQKWQNLCKSLPEGQHIGKLM